MTDPADLADPDNWTGGYYELSLLLGPHDDDRLDAALQALWAAGGLGPAHTRRPLARVEVSAAQLLRTALSCVVRVPGAGRCVGSVMVVREESEVDGAVVLGDDWLDLCLPLGSLSERDPRVGAYPFGEGAASRAWREPVEDWFAAVAAQVHAAVPVRHAVTGHEVSGTEPAEAAGGWIGLLVPDAAGGLVRHPVRRW